MWRLAALAAVLSGCTQTVSAIARDDDAGTCQGVALGAPSHVGLLLSPVVVTLRLPRVRDGRVTFAPTAACPDSLHAPAVLRWVPPRDGAVFVEDLRARGLRVWVLDACDAAPRTCLRTLGGLAERSFAVFANRPVTLAVAPLGLPDDLTTGLADIDQVDVTLVIRDLARAYDPCEIVAGEGGAMCGEDARCQGVCVPEGEVDASCLADGDCRAGLWCVGRRCALPRLVRTSRACGAGCAPGSRCVEGRCRAEVTEGAACDADAVCPATLACVAGRCGRFTPRGADCSRAPSSCTPGTRCLRAGDGLRCVDLEPPRCDAATPCATGTRCIDGRCAGEGVCVSAQTYPRVPCGDAAGCVDPAATGDPTAPPRCVRDGAAGGFCRATGARCDPGAACAIGRCVAVVGEGARCGPWSALCGRGLRCGPQSQCVRDGAPGEAGGACVGGLRCNEGAQCDPASGTCVATVDAGGPCTSSASCPRGESCSLDERRCRPRVSRGGACATSDACAAPWTCLDGRCDAAPVTPFRREGSPCTAEGDCRGGRCVAGACRFALPPGARCEGDRTCFEGFACLPSDDGRRCLPGGN